MIPELRQELILSKLNDAGILLTHEIVKHCKVSELTIRRDLIELESKGLLVRTRGGAVKSKAIDVLFAYDLKSNQNRQNKETVCQTAARHIEECDIIFMDCGTTLSLLAKYITKFKCLTVITTSLPVIAELMNYPNIRLSLIGGEIDYDRQAIYGSIAKQNIEMYHANKAFVGTDGISLKKGLSSYDDREGNVTLKMMENSDETFLLCDSSKIEKNSFINFAPISKVDHVITDAMITPEHLKMYRDFGVDVLVEQR
jgi:DeoR family fructose operon transcriptional repressor